GCAAARASARPSPTAPRTRSRRSSPTRRPRGRRAGSRRRPVRGPLVRGPEPGPDGGRFGAGRAVCDHGPVMLHARLHVAQLEVGGEPIELRYGDLVVVARAESGQLDWEVVVHTVSEPTL